MFKKSIIKTLSAVIAALMLISCGSVLAENQNEIAPLTETDTENNGDGKTENDGTENDGTEDGSEDEITEPEKTPVKISANYFDEDDSYTVIFSSLDYLENLKGFNFTVSVSDAEISDAVFGEALDVGECTVSKTGKTKVTFTNGSSENALSGKIVLCSVIIKSDKAPTAETIAFSEFTATDADGNTVTFEPELTVEEGPVVPELTEKEQEVYDLIVALPSLDSISFYDKDSKLINIDKLVETATEAAEAYDALKKAEKANVDANLEYNMKNADSLEQLPEIAAAMQAVFPVIELGATLASAKEDELLSYRFMTNVYADIKGDISSKGLPEDSTVLSQYDAAVSLISSKTTAISNKFNAATYEEKIEAMADQLKVIQSNSSDVNYEKYIDDLLDQTEALTKDMKENCDDKYKDYMLKDLEEITDEIELAKKGIKDMPTFDIENVSLSNYYYVELTRKTAVPVDADIRVEVYAEDDDTKIIDEKEGTFESGEKTAKVKLLADKKIYPKRDEYIVVHVYYTVYGAEFSLGTKTMKCRQTVNNLATGNIGIPSGGSSGSSGSSGISGGTRFPGSNDDDEDDKKDNKKEEAELFTDISGHKWAEDAIEGLYYAGIVNGMEEGVFNPTGNVTREQFCKMVVQLFGVLENDTETDFVDVDPNAWYAPYITSSIRAGYVQGQSDEYFGIGESIMRQDMATILFRALGSDGNAAVLDFTDNDDIASYAEDAIAELVGLGVINGYDDGSFKPRGTATRAEAAKVIWEVYNIINE